MTHQRVDFALLAVEQIVNQAANWHYMFGGKSSVPVVIWGIINRGGEQAAQHSQSLHSVFAHIPGLKVVMPSTPYDAKGLMIAAIRDENPVVYMDDRWLYSVEEEVPEEIYSVPLGKGIIRREGKDITIAGISYMVAESIKASEELEKEGIDVEVIDLRSVKPLDETLLFESLRKTGKLVVVDGSWKTCGMAAEISALISENIFDVLKAPIMRVTLPDAPAPASRTLEKEYYPDFKKIVYTVKAVLRK
jgi:pyruvate dehydrogenase E1 component beta subunit